MIKNKITLNVLADISKKMHRGGYFVSENTTLVLLNGSNIDLDSRLNEISKLKDHDSSLSLGFSFMGEGMINRGKIIELLEPREIYGEEDIFKLEKIVEENPRLVVPNITINTLSKVALGIIDSFASTLIWTYLYMGKSVYLDFSSVRNYLNKETKNQAIIKLREKHIKTLLDMGVIELVEGEYLNKLVEEKALVKDTNNIDLLKDSKTARNLNSKDLITESDMRKLERESILNLPVGTIITPLARDKAREKRIKIEFK